MKNIRLETVSNYLNQDDKLADIGCDHGYLGILAIQKGITFLQLIDNKQEPLNSAINNLKTYQQLATIKFTLSSGLDNLLPEINTISLCGMGGHLIASLLEKHLDKIKCLKKIILQANTDLAFLRTFLTCNSLLITNETIVKDANKFYEIIVCHYEEDSHKSALSETEIFFGPYLLMERSETFLEKWNQQLIKLERIKKDHNLTSSDLTNKIKLIRTTLNFK